MKEELSKLIVIYKEKILTEQAFRNPAMIPDEWGGLPIKPHSIDTVRSLEREYTYKEIVLDLKELIK